MTNYDVHGGAESAGKQLERMRFYENRMNEMDADRRNAGEDESGKEQVQK